MCSFGHGEGCYKPGGDALRTNAPVQDFQIMIIQTLVALLEEGHGRTSEKKEHQ